MISARPHRPLDGAASVIRRVGHRRGSKRAAATTAERIAADQPADPSVDTAALAATLTWLGERAYYLAAIGIESFTDEERLVDVLTHVWTSTLPRPSAPE